jgi:hypothetical protein
MWLVFRRLGSTAQGAARRRRAAGVGRRRVVGNQRRLAYHTSCILSAAPQSSPLKLPAPSVRKRLRDDFPGQAPLRVDRANLAEESKRWQRELRAIEGVHVTRHPGDKDSRSRTLCRFTIPDPDAEGHYWRSDELRLEYDDEGQLTLVSYRGRSPQYDAVVSDLDEIKTFVRNVLAAYARRQAAAKKREKVRQFKSKAIVAQVKKLAREQRFDFAATGDTVKVRLFVRLSERDMIEISVPFKQFEKVLPKLRETIESLRQLYDEGLRFKMMPVSHLPWDTEWIEHRSLE